MLEAGTFKRKLMKIGGSKALIIPPNLLRILEIEDEVEISTDGKILTVIPIAPKPKKGGRS